jgi:NAD(P)-dependent dehydrogenase (short-subunit alcohol dehydrogenase family)/alkylhydroperoxidase family enzyme
MTHEPHPPPRAGLKPRIPPGTRAEIGWLGALIAAALGRAARTEGPPNIFTTLARHRRLFRAWLRFAGALMPRGSLPRADTELLILRVAHNCRSEYEWAHHERIGRSAGLTGVEIERVREGPSADGWSARQKLLLQAADELHADREISDELWVRLCGELPDIELIELCMLVGHYEMLALTLNSLRVQPDEVRPAVRLRRRPPYGDELAGRRVLITGAARGIGAATAKRLHQRGARVVLAGLEPDELASVARACGEALAVVCDVREREQVEAAVEAAVEHLGGLDVVIANAGVAAQLPLIGGDPAIFERTLEVNLLGVYYTLRAAGPHIAHPRGYALAISSLAAAVHPPLLGAYSASKAGVEALANALRIELASTGAKVGVAYFGELDSDMTRRAFGTEAASQLKLGSRLRVAPLQAGVDAIERGIARRSRRVIAPAWVGAVLPARMLAQRLVDRLTRSGLDQALETARLERAPLTTELPERSALAGGPAAARRSAPAS